MSNPNVIQITNVSSANKSVGALNQRKNSTSDITEPPEMRILCFELTHYNKTTQFLLSCAGVFVLYLLYGYLQELIFTEEGFKAYGWFLTLLQFGYYILFGLFERSLEARRSGIPVLHRNIPMKTYVILAALTLGTMGLSNSSLGFLNYPTQVIFKCCKLIPVLVGSILIQGKRYGPLDFAAALAMCVGLAWFTLADSQISPNFNAIGVAMIMGALLCDAAIGNVQEKAMREHRAASSEVVLFSYGLGFIYLLVIMMITGNFFNGVAFCLEVNICYLFCFYFFK